MCDMRYVEGVVVYDETMSCFKDGTIYEIGRHKIKPKEGEDLTTRQVLKIQELVREFSNKLDFVYSQEFKYYFVAILDTTNIEWNDEMETLSYALDDFLKENKVDFY